ncbi:MAG: RHS repeat protein, partial [Planctomycetota bacterium]
MSSFDHVQQALSLEKSPVRSRVLPQGLAVMLSLTFITALLALAPVWASDHEQTVKEGASSDSNPNQCENGTCDTCDPCEELVDASCDQGDDDNSDPSQSPPSNGSPDAGVNNDTLNHMHRGTDIARASSSTRSSGCSPCGETAAAGRGSGLREVEAARIHRMREVSFASSHGPGVFSNHDYRLALTTTLAFGGVLKSIEVFDPNNQINYRFHESGPGVFTDPDHNRFAAIHLYTSYDIITGEGVLAQYIPELLPENQVLPLADVSHAVVYRHSGGRDVYELISNESRTIPINERRSVRDPEGPLVALPSGTVTAFGMYVPGTRNNLRYDNFTIYDHQGEVLYREVFPGGEGPTAEGWRGIRHAMAAPQLLQIFAGGDATGLQAVNSNPQGTEDDGFLFWGPSRVNGILMYTDEFTLDASDIASFSVQTRHNNEDRATHMVVRIGAQWYASNIPLYHEGGNDVWHLVEASATGETWQTMAVDTVIDNADVGARIVRQVDRNGRAMVYDYHYPADASGDRPWKLHTVTDPHGQAVTYTYHSEQVAGRWAIASVADADNNVTTYTYENGFLASVQHPCGDVSTFGLELELDRNLVRMDFDDAAATAAQRRKSVWVTTQYTAVGSGPGQIALRSDPMPAASQITRMVVNGEGELVYANLTANGWRYLFEGGGVLRKVDIADRVIAYATSWSFGGSQSFSLANLNATWEANSASKTYGDGVMLRRRQPSKVERADGYITHLTHSPNRRPTSVAHPDGSSENFIYNDLNQLTQRVDRLGRITQHSYDEQGNRIQTTVAVGAADEATRSWTYYSPGHINAGLLASSTDANGNTTDYIYNAQQRLVQLIEPADAPGLDRPTRTFTYDSLGRLATSSDPQGRTVTYAYDQRGRLIVRTFADASTETIAWGTSQDNTANLVVARSDRNGHLEICTYDDAGREITCVRGANDPSIAQTTLTTYLRGTRRPLSVTVDGNTTTYLYDHRLRRIGVERHAADGVILASSTVYGSNNRIVYTTDAHGRRSFPVYDANNRVVKRIQELVPGSMQLGPADRADLDPVDWANPQWVVTATEFDAQGQVLARIDARGVRSTYTYDQRGRLISHTEAADTDLAATTVFVYDAVGNRTLVTHPQLYADGANQIPHQVHTAYNGRNLPAVITDGYGSSLAASREILYTPTGRVAAEQDFRGNWTLYAYGICCDRLTQIIDPSGAVTTFLYDDHGNRTYVIDANGHTTTTTYDARHRVASVTNAEGEVTTYSYFNAVADLDPVLAAELGLDGATASGSAQRVTNPLGESVTSVHDGLGRVVRQIDALGHSSSVVYDTLVSLTDPWTGSSDTLLRTTHIDAGGVATHQDADGRGQVRRSIDAIGAVSWATYDSNGNRIRFRDALGNGEDCSFDPRNREILCTDTRISGGIVAVGQGVSRSTLYDANNRVIAASDYQGAFTQHSYDVRGRRVASTDRLGLVTSFTYDEDNNLVLITDATGSETSYVYDQRGLLIEETFPAGSNGQKTLRAYTYDPGRRLIERLVLDANDDENPHRQETTIYAYDDANRLVTRSYPDEAGGGSSDTFTYDPASRLVSAASGRYNNLVERAYDAAGRLTAETLTVTVDGFGQQVFTTGSSYD